MGGLTGLSGRSRRWLAVVGATAVVLAACEPNHHAVRARPQSTTTTAAAPTSTTAPPVTYQVKRGDNLTRIAKFFGISTAALTAANQLGNDRLTEGQVLQIPPAPPPQIAITPQAGPPGERFTFLLNGAKAGEAITFSIDMPGGRKFTGSPHTASQEGNVSTTFQSDGTNDPGTYNVVATGDRGTQLGASFRVL